MRIDNYLTCLICLQILKRALNDKSEARDFKEEDKLSQHSDSITEYRRVHRLPGMKRTSWLQTRETAVLKNRPGPCWQV